MTLLPAIKNTRMTLSDQHQSVNDFYKKVGDFELYHIESVFRAVIPVPGGTGNQDAVHHAGRSEIFKGVYEPLVKRLREMYDDFHRSGHFDAAARINTLLLDIETELRGV